MQEFFSVPQNQSLKYGPPMITWADRLRDALQRSGMSKAELSRASGVSYDSVNKYVDGKVEKPRGKTLEKLAHALKCDPLWLEKGVDLIDQVPLAGRVGAGAEIDLTNADEPGEMVVAPPNAKPGTVAVLVEGDSMFPAFEGQELLFYSQNLPPADLVNRRCVVKLADGRIFVKVLRAGSNGLWNLESLNSMYPTMTDVAVEWAAKIDWVKPR